MTRPKFSLLEGDVGPHLRRLSIPLAFGMLSMTLFALADTYFVSRLGTAALAALGFTLPVTMFFLGITFGLSVGTASVISRAYGEGNFAKVRQLSTDALVMTFIISTAAALLGLLLIDVIFPMMGAGDAVMPMIRRYMHVWYLGLPFFGLMIVGNSCMRALGNTGYASMIMTIMSVISLILDPMLIFGWGPFPELGLVGAATTLAISYIATCLFSIYTLIHRKQALSPVLWHDNLREAWKKIAHIALPSIFSNQIAPISAGIITWMAAGYGKEAVAALGVASRIEGMCILVFYAIAAGVSIFTGQNYGAGNYGRINQACMLGVRYCLIWGLAMAMLIWPFAYVIPGLFEADAKVTQYAALYLHWVPVSFGAMGAMVVINAAMNAMARPLRATALIIFRTFILYVPLAFLLQMKFGFLGIILALCATNLLSGAMAVYWQRRAMP